MFYFTLFISIIAIVILWDYWVRKQRNDILHGIYGPKGLPLLGNVLSYYGKTPKEIMSLVTTNSRKYGAMYRIWIFQNLAIFSYDPRDLEVIFSSNQHIAKSNIYKLLHNWLGTGLLLSTGSKWHKRRKIATPAFHFKILEQFIDTFERQSLILVKKLKEKADGSTAFDIFPFICLMALDIIAETAMGVKINAQQNVDVPYARAVQCATNIVAKRFINIWTRPSIIFRIFSPTDYNRLHNSIKVMHDFTHNIIMERRSVLEKSVVNENAEWGKKRHMALLDVLLQTVVDGEPLNNEDIQEEVNTFMFGGHDTTASAISFALHAISRHPEVQQKIYTEIQTVWGSNVEPFKTTLAQLSELKYLECVIKESLRLYPPAPLIGRYIAEDLEIRGKKIPAGTNFTICIFATHRSPDYFDKPDEFRPERFLNVSGKAMDPFVYIPFSAGLRNCIGQKFAMLEMKSVISKVLQHFELLPLGAEVEPVVNIILRSDNGVHLGLRPRHSANV